MYAALIWRFVLGWSFWREQPAGVAFAGTALVISASLPLAWIEHRGRSRAVDAPQAADASSSIRPVLPVSISCLRLPWIKAVHASEQAS